MKQHGTLAMHFCNQLMGKDKLMKFTEGVPLLESTHHFHKCICAFLWQIWQDSLALGWLLPVMSSHVARMRS